MRMINGENKEEVVLLQLYLTEAEALELRGKLDRLLEDPEQNEHDHLISDGRDVSFSILTDRKIASGYAPYEQRVLKAR